MTTSTITARRKGDPKHMLREKVKHPNINMNIKRTSPTIKQRTNNKMYDCNNMFSTSLIPRRPLVTRTSTPVA